MAEGQDIAKKLRFIPKNELATITRKIYSRKEQELKDILYKITGKRVRDPVKYVYNSCTSDQLIKLISGSELSEPIVTEIEKLYYEYLYGQNPNLFFSRILKPSWKEFDIIKEELPDRVSEISPEYDIDGDPKYAGFQVDEITFPMGLIEIKLFYKSRIDYIDWESGAPEKVYAKEDGIIWISKETKSMITKVSNASVNKHLKELIKDYFECDIKSFSINKEITDTILGLDSLRSGNYKSPTYSPEEAEIKILKDPHLMQKKEGRETNQKYDRKSSYHRIKLEDSEIGLNVNSQVGKIAIRAHMKKSDLRTWALETTKKIIEHLNELKDEDIEKYAKGFKLSNYSSLSDIKNKRGKEAMRNLAVGTIKIFKTQGKSSFITSTNIKDIKFPLKDYFEVLFVPSCEKCGSISFGCTDLNEIAEISIEGNKALKLNCSTCGTSFTDLNHIECAGCGEKLNGELEDYIIAILNENGRHLVNAMITELDVDRDYMINRGEVIKFQGDTFEFIKSNYKYLYLFDELPLFRHIPPLDDIDETIREAQIKNLKDRLPEKCNEYSGENCRNCLMVKKGDCIQRVVASFTEGALHAHSAVEWGDLSFEERINGNYITIPCICKSENSAYKDRYTLKNDGRLIPQVLEAISDTLIDFFGVVSGAHLDPRLKETIESLAIWKGKKIVFFDKKDMVRILSQYEWTKQSR